MKSFDFSEYGDDQLQENVQTIHVIGELLIQVDTLYKTEGKEIAYNKIASLLKIKEEFGHKILHEYEHIFAHLCHHD